MKRRTLLVSSGFALLTPLGGCISNTLGGTAASCETTDAGTNIDDYPRVDEPPHDITPPDGVEDRNDDYLGACMATDSSLAFDVLFRYTGTNTRGKLAFSRNQSYWVELVTDETERDKSVALDTVDDETRTRIEGIDFDESVLVVVESGWVSSGLSHRWTRVDEVADGLHLHGYYREPGIVPTDRTKHVSLLEVERPDDPNLARVSLTERADRRVHFDSSEGIVKTAADGEPESYTIDVFPLEENPEAIDSCVFDDLPARVQTEVKEAIETGEYLTSEPVALLESECYGNVVQYRGEYYLLPVEVS